MFRRALAIPNVGLLIGMSFLATFAFAGVEATFAMWSRRQFGWGPEQNGYLFFFVGILSALIQGGLVGRLAKRFGEARLIGQGSVALCLGLLLIPFSDNLVLLAVSMAVATYGFAVTSPAFNSLISLHVGESEQGGVMGVTRSATTMARVLGPAWAGLLFAVLGKDWPYFGGALVMAGVFIIAWQTRARFASPRSDAAL